MPHTGYALAYNSYCATIIERKSGDNAKVIISSDPARGVYTVGDKCTPPDTLAVFKGAGSLQDGNGREGRTTARREGLRDGEGEREGKGEMGKRGKRGKLGE